MISGRQSLVGARALDATELLEIDLGELRHIVKADAELSELFLRAFVLRRALAEHATQAQEDEYRQRQEYDGVVVELVSHAFGNRNARSTRGP